MYEKMFCTVCDDERYSREYIRTGHKHNGCTVCGNESTQLKLAKSLNSLTKYPVLVDWSRKIARMK